jgi:hypothetical protein
MDGLWQEIMSRKTYEIQSEGIWTGIGRYLRMAGGMRGLTQQ